MHKIFITCPKGIENLLAEEAKSLGLENIGFTVGGVHGEASLEAIYQLNLWSRLGNRVLLSLFSEPAKEPKEIYELCKEYPWEKLFIKGKTLSVHFKGQSAKVRNEMFGAQCVKDAVVDRLRDKFDERPDIDPKNAQCNVHARLHRGIFTAYYDLSGHSLHQRGYRDEAGQAPLKENLAAALLVQSGWPAMAEAKKPMIDPCCGSGTLLIEAAMIATKKAPGLTQENFGFMHWQEYDETLWNKLVQQANETYEATLKEELPKFQGYDQNHRAIKIAKANARYAGFEKIIQFQQQDFQSFKLPEAMQETPGLLIANPPYGERLNVQSELIPLYQQLGGLLAKCQNWQAGIITSEKVLAKAIGLRSKKQYKFYNGTLECKLYLFDISEENKSAISHVNEQEQMLINRLTKNLKKYKSWLKKEEIQCYRIYDADLPEYAFAVDVYNDWVHVQEYLAPKEIPLEKTQQRMFTMLRAIPNALGIAREKLVFKQRQKQKGKQQYEKQAQTQHKLIVREGHAKILVNLKDYLDTGLFLDHRLIRLKFNSISKDKSFLNLFCYTATASVHAALGGAWKTVNVDMSQPYLNWAKENFKINQLNLNRHDFIQADCLKWLKESKEKFDIIFLDPPSFSNSKRMDNVLDIQRDHMKLIEDGVKLLKPNGELYFSTNLRKFKLDPKLKEKFNIKDITQETIDKDFERNKHIHQCYLISR